MKTISPDRKSVGRFSETDDLISGGPSMQDFSQKRLMQFGCFFAISLVLLSVIVSCTPNPKNKSTNAKGSGPSISPPELLSSAMHSLDPHRLGIKSDRASAVKTLNDWAQIENDGVGPALDQAAETLLEKYLTTDELSRVRNNHFLMHDGLQIRNSLWYKSVIGFATGKANNDLDRIVNLFDHVIRTIDLVDNDPVILAVSPYGSAMLGKGLAENRAWLFANLLRQLKFDAYIIRPSGELAKTNADAWLVGVALDDKIYLFDPRLGLPIPFDSESPTGPFVRRPATLVEVQENDGLLRHLDVDDEQRYPFTSADLKNPRVEIIGDTGYWAPRMRRLELALTAKQAVIVSDLLIDTKHGPGAIRRAIDSGKGKWPADNVALWKFAEARLRTHDNLSDSVSERLRIRKARFNVPRYIVGIVELLGVVRKKDGQGVWQGDRRNVKDEGDFLRISLNDEKQPDLLFSKADHTFVPDIQVNFGAPQKRQLKTRTNQLVGHYQNALSSYLLIQLWKYMPPLDPAEKRGLKPEDELRLLQLRKIPAHLLKMHHEAAVDALFWSGACQFELGKYRSAIGSFQRYRQQNPDDSWEHASRYMQSLAYAKSNQIDKAIAELSQSSRRAPQSAGYTILLRRWQKWQTIVDENRKDTP